MNAIRKIFFSYNRDDASEIYKIHKYLLKEKTLEIFIDIYSLESKERWRYEIEQAIKKSEIALIFVGKTHDNDSTRVQHEEIDIILNRRADKNFNAIVIYLKDAPITGERFIDTRGSVNRNNFSNDNEFLLAIYNKVKPLFLVSENYQEERSKLYESLRECKDLLSKKVMDKIIIHELAITNKLVKKFLEAEYLL